jgi:competence protein ComEC
MFLFVIAFLFGDLYLQLFSTLPSNMIGYSTVIVSFLCWIRLKKYGKYYHLPFAFMVGFAWSLWYANSQLAWSLPDEAEGKPVRVIGYIASLPVTDSAQTSFMFSLEKLQYQGTLKKAKTSIRLSWRRESTEFNYQPVKVGDKWQFLVRLKRIHSTQNPGSFDFEAWAFQKGLRASGYILSGKDTILLSHDRYRYPIDQFRQVLQEKIKSHLPSSKTAPWLMALMIGERNGIAKEDWEVLRNTGTNHLMAIAGLHIGMMAGFAHTLVSWLWRRSSFLALKFPAPLAGSCAALITAMLYSALAGFSIPTQRACIMLTVFILALLLRRKINAWHSWSLAMLLVLFINPLCVLTESFWLSFGTIALIIYGMSGRLASTGWWWKWGRVQWVIGIGLIPLTLTLFQECSFISFIANSIAIPWLGFFILPFCFLSTIFLLIFPSLGGVLLSIADKSLAALWVLLTWFSQLHFSAWHQVIPTFGILIISVIGFLFLLLPAGFPGKWLGLLWLIPLILYKPERPISGDFWMTLLDVGQGLSVIVQTKEHTLVYDTGPTFNANFDMGERVVLPYLRTTGVNQIDMLIISHGDNDHLGGAQILLASLPILSIKTSVPDRLPRADYCYAGYSWQWDGVNFSFIYPAQNDLDLGNDSSCVLSIDNGSQRVLLTGDIEKYAENNIVMRSPMSLSSSILIAPHHGSKTSSTRKFVAAVHPQFVLYATGYRNRYHFPHQRVVTVYEEIHAEQFNTVNTGAIQFKLTKENTISPPVLYRVMNKRYWYDHGTTL